MRNLNQSNILEFDENHLQYYVHFPIVMGLYSIHLVIFIELTLLIDRKSGKKMADCKICRI